MSQSREVSIAYLRSFAVSRSEVIGYDLIIHGNVVANDKFREFTRGIVIDDGTAGIAVQVDVDNADILFPLFSEVKVRCSGLSIGRDGARIMLGAYPSGRYVVDRIAESEVQNYINSVVLPERWPEPMFNRISELTPDMVYSYVAVDDLCLIAEERGLQWCDTDSMSGAVTTTVRHFTDGVDTLRVVTYSECQYATEVVPEGRVLCAGVLDYYDGAIALRLTDKQIIRRFL